jgi:hypothetical protein
MTPPVLIKSSDAHYPSQLGRRLSHSAPTTLSALGNLDLLALPKTALFCSARCPGHGRLIAERGSLVADDPKVREHAHYQHANRVATLHFLTKHGIQARLIFLYFCGDRHPDDKFCPANPEEWKPTLQKIDENLGLKRTSTLEQRVHNVFVNVDLPIQ